MQTSDLIPTVWQLVPSYTGREALSICDGRKWHPSNCAARPPPTELREPRQRRRVITRNKGVLMMSDNLSTTTTGQARETTERLASTWVESTKKIADQATMISTMP